MYLFKKCEIKHQTKNRVRIVYESLTLFNIGSLKRYLLLSDEILEVRVNRDSKSIVIYFDAYATDSKSVVEILKNIDALKFSEISNGTSTKSEDEKIQSAIPLLRASSMVAGSLFLSPSLNMPLSLLACYPALSLGARNLFSSGVTSEVLEAMAISISLYRRDFVAANMTNFLIELGLAIEESIERKSDDMLQSLLVPKIDRVWVERDGEEIEIDSNSVVVGDKVVVGSGSTISVDGTILSGEALVNEASMTGESALVRKIRGDRAISGTIVEEGRISIWAEHVGKQSATYRISEYVKSSLENKSNMQLDASKLADKLVPITLGLGAFTYLASRDLSRVAAVFQADYSCSLKLATPVAFKSSMYKAGVSKILIKGADVLERLSSVDVVVFDKTGTLTTGDLEVKSVYSLNSEWDSSKVLSLAASIEEHYFHPVAQAVVKAASECENCNHFNHSEVDFIVAHGVSAMVGDKKVVIGSRHFLEDDEKICFKGQDEFIDREYKDGSTLLYIGYDGELLGVIVLRDSLREESEKCIKKLRELGVKEIIMLSGDYKERAKELSEKLNIDRYYAELLPHQKAEIVDELKSEGKKIAFVGDGINDAPALSSAHVGVAMQKGADIARVSADIALLEDSLYRVAEAKDIANKTTKLVDDNYNITIGANSVILILAALGVLSPIATSIFHNGTTIGVLAKALGGIEIEN